MTTRFSQGLRKLAPGTIGGQSRVATLVRPNTMRQAATLQPGFPPCPVYVGQIPDQAGVGWELDGSKSLVYAGRFDGPRTVFATYTFPGLNYVQDLTSSDDVVFTAEGHGLCVAGGRILVKWTDMDDVTHGYRVLSTPVTGGSPTLLITGVGPLGHPTNPSGVIFAGGICRNGADPSRYYLVHITSVSAISGIQNWWIYDGDPATPTIIELASGTAPTGTSSFPFTDPISTPDGAIWMTVGATDGGHYDIVRWDPNTGLITMAPGIGSDSPDPLDPIGPAGSGPLLIPRPDNSVWWHSAKLFDHAGEHELGYRTDADLVTTVEPCMEYLDGTPFPELANIQRNHAAASSPGAELAVFGPFNSMLDQMWRIGG